MARIDFGYVNSFATLKKEDGFCYELEYKISIDYDNEKGEGTIREIEFLAVWGDEEDSLRIENDREVVNIYDKKTTEELIEYAKNDAIKKCDNWDSGEESYSNYNSLLAMCSADAERKERGL